ncbi:MAG TPA: glycogen debranching protein GlgX [Microthrixaceae bacterium]|nr:glycogen debranching protein GlgX [Microthrixaceae bacterium]
MEIWPGRPAPLGATWDGAGTNVAVFSGGADHVELCLFDDDGAERRIELPERHGDVWHGYLPDVGPGTRYGFRVRGDRPDEGSVYSEAKLLLDPYAHAIEGEVTWGEALLDNDLDSAATTARSVVVDPAFEWEGDRPPAVPWNEMVVYEAHVRGMTKLHPGVPDEWRGSFLGMGSPAVVDHLRSLGVTAVELLPIHHFVPEGRLVEAGLTNYWGYNSISYLAPHPAYASGGGDGLRAVDEFKTMVRSLHRAGIEVILDVVYNHTAEGGFGGPILSFRGLDNSAYYRLDPEDPTDYVDYTGCGNSLNMRHPNVLQLIMDSLRYWVTEMHVDGFRFDLASALARELHDVDRLSAFFDLIQQDPVVNRVKLIAEPWDVGEGGYQVGNFPPQWSEWNGRYRDTVRDFWRGTAGTLGELAERLCGSSDLYQDDRRKPHASINFVTCHDGFTLADLVSYNDKHNETNGEDNRDGTDDNRSWNCGVEGPTDDESINELRARQRRNFVATVLTSQGVPMFWSGDELGHSQHGMNNAYAQDNEISWLDWTTIDEPFLEFCRRMAAFRRAHPVLRRRGFLEGRPTGPGERDDIAWFGPDGARLDADRWQAEQPRALVCYLNGNAITEPDLRGERIIDDSVLLVFNGEPEGLDLTLPAGPWPHDWAMVVDTRVGMVEPPRIHRAGEVIALEGRSVLVFVAAE